MGRERREGQAARKVVAVGLTGGIGAGKSTALGLFGDLGASTCSADEIVHQLYEQPAVAAAVAAKFGDRVLTAQGGVDRASLAGAVRGKPERLRWLEELTHPLVTEEIERRMDSAPECSVLVCEVPLLFEAGYERLFDTVVTVEAGPEVRRQRSDHDFDLEQFSELEALQASRERRTKGSDFAFSNEGGLEALREFVDRVYVSALADLKLAGCEDAT